MTIVPCDANWVMCPLLGMAWIQITFMLNGNFKGFNVSMLHPNETVRLGVTGMAKCWL